MKEQSGYILLLSLLITGAVSLTAGLFLLTGGIDSQRVQLVWQQSAKARAATDSCAEEALQQIHDNTSFSGTNSLALAEGSCSYVVITTPGHFDLTATGSVQNITRKIRAYGTINSSSLSISSWQEVGDL